MKTILSSILLVTMTIFFTACDSNTQKTELVEITSIESKYMIETPKFTLTTTKGEKITLEVSNQTIFSKQLDGKIVLINFWAPWCKPCIKEMPSFVKLQEKYKDNFIILGVLFDKKYNKKELSEFMKKFNVNFPVTIGKENFELAKAFDDVKMVPESFLYSKDGIFIEKFIGEISAHKLEEYIKNNLK